MEGFHGDGEDGEETELGEGGDCFDDGEELDWWEVSGWRVVRGKD